MDYPLTRRVLEAFEIEGLRYVIFGGVAINLQGLARATQDLDVFIEPTEENVGRLKAALQRVFDDPEIAGITADDLLGDYPAVMYAPPQEGFHVDVLTRLGLAFEWKDLESQRLDFDGVEVTVATPAQLWRMKRDTVRPRDRIDAQWLADTFGLRDQ